MAKRKKMPKALKAYFKSLSKKRRKKKSKKKKKKRRGSGYSKRKGGKRRRKFKRISNNRGRMTYAQRARAYLQMGRLG